MAIFCAFLRFGGLGNYTYLCTESKGTFFLLSPKTVRFIPTRQELGFNIWSIDHKLPKGSQPKGKGILIRLSPILEKMFLGTQKY